TARRCIRIQRGCWLRCPGAPAKVPRRGRPSCRQSPVARQTRRVCRRVVPLSLVARIAWPSAPPADPKKYSPKQRAGCGVSNMAAEQTSPEVASTLLRVKGLRKFYEQRRWLSRRRFEIGRASCRGREGGSG